MGLGGEVHHDIGLMAHKYLGKCRSVADVGLLEAIAAIVLLPRLAHIVAGVSQLVEVDDLGVRLADEIAHDGRADEASSAGDAGISWTTLPASPFRLKDHS